MADELLDYYRRELIYLRQDGKTFSEKYPHDAPELKLEPGRHQDPHVERLLEGFAFLAARVHRKIDSDFPEITESLFNVLYPQFVRPVPSMSVVEFQRKKLTQKISVKRGSFLQTRQAIGDVKCKVKVCYDTTIWPVRVSEAQWRRPERLKGIETPGAAAICRMVLECDPGVTFGSIGFDTVSFYLSGSSSSLTRTLYELLIDRCIEIVVREPESVGSRSLRLPRSALRAMGFSEQEAMLEYSRPSFSGYRLLQEYFAFPEKFLFLELSGLQRLAEAGFTTGAELIFLISHFHRAERQEMLEQGVLPETFRLNCTPVINLFTHGVDGIQIDQTRSEYRIVPDLRKRSAYEVFSVDKVVSVNLASRGPIELQPLFAAHYRSAADGGVFWQAHRRPAIQKDAMGRDQKIDDGAEIWLTLTDLDGNIPRPGLETLDVVCTCTNRDLLWSVDAELIDFEMIGASPVSRIVSLRKPTPSLRPALGKGQLWRLVSHLSLSYLSITGQKEALQSLLVLYNFSKQPEVENQINSILAVKSEKQFAPMISKHGIDFARGTRVEMDINESEFPEGGAFLFGAVLEHFLGQYVTLNSFSQLVIRTPQRNNEILKKWAPRAGYKILQ